MTPEDSKPPEVQAIVVQPQAITIVPDFAQEPKVVLARAEKVAKALKSFLDRKGSHVQFNGRRYPQAEDWQFVATFFGHTARVREVRELRNHDVLLGYVAFAEVVNPASHVVSSAEAACMFSEPNWSKKPDFQIRSMAQTRACAKALRNVFAWVMVLAGLAPTPAEEMPEIQMAAAICSECGEDIWDGKEVYESRKNFGKTLCRVCRKHATPLPAPAVSANLQLKKSADSAKVQAARIQQEGAD